MYRFILIHTCMYICVSACACMYMHISLCVYLFAYVYICACMCEDECMCVCACVCVCVCKNRWRFCRMSFKEISEIVNFTMYIILDTSALNILETNVNINMLISLARSAFSIHCITSVMKKVQLRKICRKMFWVTSWTLRDNIVSLCACVYVCVCVCVTCVLRVLVSLYVCVYVCAFVCVCIRVWICLCTFVCV